MVINIPGALFNQKDVRETASENFAQSNFNTNDFTVGADIVSLKNKTSYWSIAGNQFIAIDSGTGNDTTNVTRGIFASGEGGIEPDGNGIFMIGQVNLPHRAIVTGIIMYGDAAATAESYFLMRHTINTLDSQSKMGEANIGTADTSISNATIDNQNFSYWLETTTMDAQDTIFGAVITYTTDYD